MKLFPFLFSLIFLFICTSDLSGQFGVRTKYNLNTFSNWDNFLKQNVNSSADKIFPSNIEIGVDYWFRLKNYRIEFMPEIAMGLKTQSTYPSVGAETGFSYFAFNMNTHIYAFDLEGDCDCPTFSKQGPSLNKGFFFNIAPGLIYNSKEISIETTGPSFKSNQVNLRIGIGAGFDIGISDLFTITPIIMYNIARGINFDELSNINTGLPFDDTYASGLNQIQFQLRFGFRPDYVKVTGEGGDKI